MGRARGGGVGGRVGWDGMGFDWERKVWGGEGVEVMGEVGSCIRWDELMIL